MDIDFSKIGATTIMSCGLTNVGHFAYIQQGLSGNADFQEVRGIFETLAQYAPELPKDEWELIAIDLKDYKLFHNAKFYKVQASFKFSKIQGPEYYIKEVNISWEDAQIAYALFRKAAYQIEGEK